MGSSTASLRPRAARMWVPDVTGRGELCRCASSTSGSGPSRSPRRSPTPIIDFSKMTCSIVAVVTDVVRDGAPVVGYGFNSNGRYGQGALLRERLLPRLAEADPADAARRRRRQPRPVPHLGHHDAQREAGRPWRAFGRGRHARHGDLGRGRQDRGQAALPPARRTVRRRRADDKVWVYAAGGYYYPGKDLSGSAGRDAQLSRPRLHVVKMKIGGAPLAEDLKRIEAVLAIVGDGQTARGRRQRPLRPRRPRSPMPRRSSPMACSGTRRRAIRSTIALQAELSAQLRRRRSPPARTCSLTRTLATCSATAAWTRTATGCSSTARCPMASSNICARSTFSSRTAGRSRRVVPHGGHQMSLNIAAGLHLGGNESYPDVFQPVRRLCRRHGVVDGHVRLPDGPGVGFEAESGLFALLRKELRLKPDDGSAAMMRLRPVIRPLRDRQSSRPLIRDRLP